MTTPPSGTYPELTPLAKQIRSGWASQFCQANHCPARPKPAITSSAIHDWETAYQGATSEDVAQNLPDGSFGFWRETMTALNGAAKRAQQRGEGYGLAIGRTINEADLPHRRLSVFAEAARLGVPATVHVAFGCDITHMDPDLDGAALGAAT